MYTSLYLGCSWTTSVKGRFLGFFPHLQLNSPGHHRDYHGFSPGSPINPWNSTGETAKSMFFVPGRKENGGNHVRTLLGGEWKGPTRNSVWFFPSLFCNETGFVCFHWTLRLCPEIKKNLKNKSETQQEAVWHFWNFWFPREVSCVYLASYIYIYIYIIYVYIYIFFFSRCQRLFWLIQILPEICFSSQTWTPFLLFAMRFSSREFLGSFIHFQGSSA